MGWHNWLECTFPYAAFGHWYDVRFVWRKECLSCMAWCSISEFNLLGSKRRAGQYQMEVNEGQVNTRWLCRQLLMEFWKTLTVIVSLDVQQDIVPVKKQNWSVLVFVLVAIAQILPTRIQNTQNDLMAMKLDSMEYLKNNDGNAFRYYLRSATDQYLFTYWIFSFGSTVFIL
jgi:hypothetical protein